MRKVVINKGYGSFTLSQSAIDMLVGMGVEATKYCCGLDRDDPRLVKVVKTLGGIEAKDDGDTSDYLKIVCIPSRIDWVVKSYDGDEWVAEKHRTWGK